jgi:hypothetical protein
LKLTDTRQPETCDDEINLLGKNIESVNKTQEAILVLNAEKIDTTFVSHPWNVGSCHRIDSQPLDNISFG